MILDTGVQVIFSSCLFNLIYLSLSKVFFLDESLFFLLLFSQFDQPNLNPGFPLDGSQMFWGGDKAGLQVSSGTAGILLKTLTNLQIKVYIQNLRAKQPEKPRRLFVTIMGKESKRFTRCFHGWGPMRTVPAWFAKNHLFENFTSNDHRYILWSLHCTKHCPNRRKCCLSLYISNRNFLSTMHIWKHMDTVHCPMLLGDITDQKYHCYSFAASNVFIPLYFRKGVFPAYFRRRKKSENYFRCDVMGVAVLQLYPVQDNRTGPQVVDLLTKRIMNQGFYQRTFFKNLHFETQVLHRQDNSLLTVKFTRVSLRLPIYLLRICEFSFDLPHAIWYYTKQPKFVQGHGCLHTSLHYFQYSDTFCTTLSVLLLFSQSSKPTARQSLWPRTPSSTCWCSSWPTCTRRRPLLRVGDPGAERNFGLYSIFQPNPLEGLRSRTFWWSLAAWLLEGCSRESLLRLKTALGLILANSLNQSQVEYCPGVVPNNCWGILLEFMQVGQRREKTVCTGWFFSLVPPSKF